MSDSQDGSHIPGICHTINLNTIIEPTLYVERIHISQI